MSLLQLGWADKARGLAKFLAVRARERPYSITLELTRRCNARCDYCDHWREPRRSELDTAGFVDVVRHFDPLSVTLCGGEPFMRRDNDRHLPGLFARIAHIVPWMVARGANVQLNSILMQDNLDEAIPIVRLAESWGARVLFTLYSELPAGNRSHLFPPAARERLRALVEELRMLRRTRGVVANEDWYLEHIPLYVDGEPIAGCNAGKRTIHITPQGMVRPCAELPPIAHYKDFDAAAQPWTDCTACFQACRGEVQAPISLKRLVQYLAA